ncbi:MAG: NAD(P)/FAD-dependent oxidoreductase [Candidatus Omnitrophica bacterium]|nr:NAD(P)/FAD-dependent oxidoreductase [Candidatus Omnitrophota bacterium]
MKQYDVVIIGGGVIGASIARELSRYKLSMALFEKEEELAFGVSKSNSGIIHSGTQNPPGSLKAKLCVQGNALTRKIAGELGVDLKEVGSLIVAFTEEERLELLKIKKDAEILGVPGLKIVGRDWIRKHEPNLSAQACAALYASTTGIISPYRLVYDLCENAARNGVEFHLSSKVEKISALPVSDGKSSPRFEISTPKGSFRTRYLVNAAGLYADEISKMAGAGGFKIIPRKGEEFLLDKKREHLVNHVLYPLPTEKSKGILIIKTSDGNPMIGPTAHDVTDKEDLSTSDEGLKEVLESARKMIPTISESDIIAYFSGLRPTAGHDFIIRHENAVPGLLNVAGIQSPGLTSAPAIALMARDILKDNGLILRKKRFFHRHQREENHLFAIPLDKAKKLVKKDASYGDIVCRCEMVSAKEITDAISRGAMTLDGIKFRTRAQAGRCHGGFCTTRVMKILAEKTRRGLAEITKRGRGSEIVKGERGND